MHDGTAVLHRRRRACALRRSEPRATGANPAQTASAWYRCSKRATCVARSRVRDGAPADRAARLAEELGALDLSPDVLGPVSVVSRIGPDHAGRFEFLFAALRRALHGCIEPLDDLLSLSEPAGQAERAAPGATLSRCIDQAMDDVLRRSNLVCLFGEEAVRNPAASFAKHFSNRLRHVLATLPAKDNPYLWQMLKGCYPPGTMAPWLAKPRPARIPSLTWELGTIVGALADRPGEFDFVHLSNILDWLGPDDARTTLDVARRALRPGGWTLIRQLNSTLDVERLGDGFEWHVNRGKATAPSRPQLFLSSAAPREKTVNVHTLETVASSRLAGALERFERQFTYPLGSGRSFRISHGDDYVRFFRAMGEARCFVAERDRRVLGVLGAALRPLVFPGRRTAYGVVPRRPEGRPQRPRWADGPAAWQPLSRRGSMNGPTLRSAW